MNRMETDPLKPRLREYLEKHGVKFGTDKLFLCPFHDDHKATMGIVPESGGINAHCFSCDANADIYRFGAHYYGLDEKNNFPEIKKRVAAELGEYVLDHEPAAKQKVSDVPVMMTLEASRAVYTAEAILKLGGFIFGRDVAPGAELKIEKAYPCRNEAGDVEFVEARFLGSCFANGQKRTAAMWWNGKNLLARNTPHGLFGRELLRDNPDKPILIVEGPKCWDAAKEKLPSFVPIAWNGGAHGQKKINFSPLAGRRVYIYPDDDEPGGKSAHITAKMLKGIAEAVIIVQPMPEARAVKPEKADIVEALQVKTAEEVTAYIFNATPLDEALVSKDPYINAGLFLSGQGFYRIYDKKSVDFFSINEKRSYSHNEIKIKFKEDKIDNLNPAEMAKMIDNLDPVYPVYTLVKSYAYPPMYQGRDGNKNEFILNRWQGFPYPLNKHGDNPDAEKQAELVKYHIREILCGGNAADYDYFCKWVAHLMQKPDVKPGVAIYAQSTVQGTGKSVIFEKFIPNMLGVDNTIQFSNKDQIGEKFNSWLYEKIYVVFSEQSFYENTENIKTWITEAYSSRRDMMTESRTDKSFARFVICTNKYNAFHFEGSERRMFVLDVSPKRVKDYEYFDKLHQAVESAAVLDIMARFFYSINISDWNPADFPASEKKQEMIEAEKSPIISFFESVLNGEYKDCRIKPCEEADPWNGAYYDCEKLYRDIKTSYRKGEFFIERGRLFKAWQEGPGRYKPGTTNSFSHAIKIHYEDRPGLIKVVNDPVRVSPKEKRRLPFIIIDKKFFEQD